MILVTGGLGFIGSHIALNLLAKGHEVVLVDNLVNSTVETLQRLEYISSRYIPFVKLDIRNTPSLNKVLEQYPIEAVIHTAGFKSLEESVIKPLEYYNDNLSGMMSLLRAMQRTGIRKLIHLSSLTVYGTSSLDLSENLAFNFEHPNPYIKTQQMMEEIIRDTATTDTEWDIAILRLANVVGAFEYGVLGEVVETWPKNIVPLALQVASGQRESLEIYQDCDTTDGTVERNFIHVQDVCEAIFLSLQWVFSPYSGVESFNIASDENYSIIELLKVIEKVTHTTIPTVKAKHSIKVLEKVGSSSQKALDILTWKAKLDLNKMIEDQWLYFKNSLSK